MTIIGNFFPDYVPWDQYWQGGYPPPRSHEFDRWRESSSPRAGGAFKIEDAHAYALQPQDGTSTSGTQTPVQNSSDNDDDETLEQTRVAVQALQDIANDFNYLTQMSSGPMQTTVQNVTLNSGRMIQVVVQGPADQMVSTEQVIEAVEQIEIDSSVESIIPISEGQIIETVVEGEVIQNT